MIFWIRSMAAGTIWLSLAGIAMAQEGLSGRYFGIDDAAGASISINPDSGGYSGTFFDSRGASQSFEADRDGDAAEAVLDMDGRTVLMRMAPLPFGAEVAIIPFNAQGQLLMDASRRLKFLRDGVKLPEKPLEFIDAPRDPGITVAANAFLVSYEFWEPVGVRNGYLGLPDRFRTLLRMFPAVQLDVIWKLCLAPAADRALGIALRGQGVACPDVLDGVAHAQRSGRFAIYKGEVDEQRDSLRTSVRCADGYVESKAACDAASARLAKAAVSLKTAASVLARYRSP